MSLLLCAYMSVRACAARRLKNSYAVSGSYSPSCFVALEGGANSGQAVALLQLTAKPCSDKAIVLPRSDFTTFF